MSDFLSSLRGAASRLVNGDAVDRQIARQSERIRQLPAYRAAARNFSGIDGPGSLRNFTISTGSALDDAQVSAASNRFADDINPSKDFVSQARDTALDVTGGFVGGVLNLGALAASGVSASQRAVGLPTYDAGVPIAQFAEDTADVIRSGRTRAAKDAGEASEAVASVIAEQNRADELAAIEAGANPWAAGAERIFSDVVDTGGNILRQPEALGSGIASGIGSLLLGGPVAKGTTSVVTAGTRALTARGLMTPQLAGVISQSVERAAMTGSIAAMEAGGAYSQAANAVMGMEEADLIANSPQYARMVNEEGMDPARARNLIASRAGSIAASLQAPVAAATGRMVAGFEAAPLAGRTVRASLANVGKETVEEGIQSFSGQLNSNIGVRLAADETQDLGEGVGRGLAEGAIFGAGTAGVFAGPNAALGVVERVPAAVRRMYDGIQTRGAGINSKDVVDNIAAGTAAVDAATSVMERAAPIDTSIDPIDDASEREQFAPQVEAISQAFRFDPVDHTPENDAETRLIASMGLEKPHNIFTAMTAAIGQLESEDISEGDKVDLVLFINSMQERITPEMMGSVLDLQSKATVGGSMAKAVSELLTAQDFITKNKTFNDVMTSVLGDMGEVTVDDIAEVESPEGQQAAKKAAMQALLTPENIGPEVVARLFKHSIQRPSLFSRSQALALRSTAALNQTLQEAEALAKQTGAQLPSSVRVAGQVQTGNFDQDSTGLSVLEHYKDVIEGLSREGDGGLEALTEFRNFAQHMANKLKAVNQSFTTREGGTEEGKNPTVSFDTYTRKKSDGTGGNWNKSGNAVYAARFSTDAGGSIPTVQQIGLDAEYTIGTYNKLVAQNPQLGLEPVEAVRMDDGLRKSPKAVLKDSQQKQMADRRARSEAATNKQQKQPEPKAPVVEDRVREEDLPERYEGSFAEQADDLRKEMEDWRKQGLIAEEAPVEETPKDAPYNLDKIKGAPTKVLENRLVEIQGRMFDETPLPNDAANFERISAELSARETPVDTDVSPSKTEAASVVAEPEAQPEVTATEEAAPLSLKEQFSNLVQSTAGENLYTDGFVPNREEQTALAGPNAIGLMDVINALKDGTKLAALGVDSSKLTAVAQNAYTKLNDAVLNRAIPRMYKQMKATKDRAMQRQLKGEPLAAKGQPLGIDLVGLRLVNLMERDPEQGLKFNATIMSAGALALADWMAQNSIRSPFMNKADIAESLGIPATDVSDALAAAFNSGVVITSAQRDLMKKIQRYLGVTPEQNTPDGLSRGVLLSFADALLEAAIAENLISSENPFDKDDENSQNFQFIRTNMEEVGIKDDAGFGGQITLIDQIITKDTSAAGYDLKPSTRESKSLLRSQTPLTQEEQDTRLLENQIGYTINSPVVNFFRFLDKEGIVDLFGNGSVLAATLNKNDRLSKDSQNKALIAAYQSLMGMVDQMTNAAAMGNLTPADIKMYFEHEFSSVSRMQQQGVHNPQSSKIVREALTPTRVTLDLSDETSDAYFMWRRGLAQALGVKVELLEQDAWDKELSDLLNKEEMQEAFELLTDTTTSSPAEVVGAIRAAIKDPSVVAVHAMISHVEYLKAKEAGALNAFETSVYVEADGKTDGPTNSLFYMALGGFTKGMIAGLRRGGIVFDRVAQSLPSIYSIPGMKDAYETAGDETAATLESNLKTLLAKAKNNGAKFYIQQGFDDTMLVLSTLIGDPKQFKVSEKDGKLTFVVGRKQLKNPMTVTVYGSSATGISDKIARELVDQLYEQISEAHRRADAAGNPGLWSRFMFAPNESEVLPTAEVKAFFDALQRMSVSFEKGGIPSVAGKAVDYTLNGLALKNMSEKIRKFYVNPMRVAINKTIGNEPGQPTGSELIQTATNQMSAVARAAFIRRLSEKMEGRNNADGISPAEGRELIEDIAFLLPYIEGDAITVNVKGLEPAVPELINPKTGKRKKALSGHSFTGPTTAELEIPMPALAGVAGAAYVNISYGDGRMIIKASEGLIGGRLHIFDGINNDLVNAKKNGVTINKAVLDAMQTGTPFQDLNKAFQGVGQSLNFDIFTEEEMYTAWTNMNPDSAVLEGAAKDAVKAQIKDTEAQLREAALQEQARHIVFKKVHISSDHMGALSAPASTDGDDTREDLGGLSDDQQEKRLNELYLDAITTLRNEKVETTEAIDSAFERFPKDETGVRKVSTDQLDTLLNSMNLPPQQKLIIQRAAQALRQKAWTVVIGSKAAANRFTRANGIPHHFGKDDFGLTVPNLKTMIVANGSSETLAHEMIHAATTDKVDQFYADPTALDDNTRAAITRLEALQNEWLDVVEGAYTFREKSSQKSVQEAKKVITDYLTAGDQAGALNEFMAWNLSNQDISKLNTTIRSKLANIATKVMNELRRMFKLPPVTKDMNSQILFNTLIVMGSKPVSLNTAVGQRMLQHSTGTRPDLDVIIKKMANLVSRADMGQKIWKGQQKPSELATAAGLRVGDTVVQNGFKLTNEERYALSMIMAAYEVNMVRNPAFAIKANAYHRELLAQMNQTNMAEGDAMDPGENALARQRIALLDGSVFGGKMTVPLFVALTAVSPQARKLLSRMQVRAKKEKAPGTTMDEAVIKVSGELVDSVMDASLGIQTNQKIGEAMDKMVLNFIEQVDKEKNFLQTGLEYPGKVIRGANTKLSDGVSYGLGKLGDALQVVINSTPEGSAAYKAAEFSKIGVQMLDKNRVEEATDRLMSELDSREMNSELRAFWTSIMGSNETNQDVFVLIKQGRAIIDRAREAFRTGVPKQIVGKFTRDLTEQEWNDVHSLGQVDASVLIGQGMSDGGIVDLLADPALLQAVADQKVADIRRLFGANAPAILGDSSDLAALIVKRNPKHGLVKKNALAIANRVGEAKVGAFTLNSEEVRAIDAYVSAIALQQLPPKTTASLSNLAKTQKVGMRYALSLMGKARAIEVSRIPEKHIYNVPKGYMPTERLGSFKAVRADKLNDYTKTGYRVVGSRKPSAAEALYDNGQDIFYVATDLTPPAFRQGIMRTVRATAFGIDAVSGLSFETPSAGLIVNPKNVDLLSKALQSKKQADATLSPLYDENGKLYAFERLIDPNEVSNALETQQNGAVSLGHWLGRQHEENEGAKINAVLIDRLAQMYESAGRQARTNEYVDLFELEKTDPVYRDAMALISDRDKAMIRNRFGDKFMVRKALVDNTIGIRSLSVTDPFTGNSRLKAENQEALANFMTGLLGPQAYRYLTVGEQGWNNLMGDARVAIVVKSMLVPALNAMANFYQLMANGIGPVQIAQKSAEKLRETHLYAKNELETQRLSVELAAAEGSQRPDLVRRIQTELDKIQELNRQLSIWPLIEAGEFSQVTEGLTQDDMEMTRGRIWDYVSKLADRLPPAVKTAGRYAVVSKDTALFAGLAKTVAYTDFVAKAVLYDHLRTNEKLDMRTARLRITNEFVNYDILDGRVMAYAESMGLAWFWKFKLRAVKVAASLMRNNPLHVFLSSMVPGSYEAGTVMDDNGLNLFLDGRFDNSIGIDNAWRALELNPINQIVN